MFQAQFAPLVQAGLKTQTIRPFRKRPLRLGERLSLRRWSGLPYRSKQVELGMGEVTFLCHITIGHHQVVVTQDISTDEIWKSDGFDSWEAMEQWFAQTHGLPFSGTLIRWKLL